MSVCNLCPRACKVVRRESITGEGQLGYCQSGMLPVISRAASSLGGAVHRRDARGGDGLFRRVQSVLRVLSEL